MLFNPADSVLERIGAVVVLVVECSSSAKVKVTLLECEIEESEIEEVGVGTQELKMVEVGIKTWDAKNVGLVNVSVVGFPRIPNPIKPFLVVSKT